MAQGDLVARMLGAAKLNVDTFEEVEADETATGQAAAVVAMAAVASAIGSADSGVLAAAFAPEEIEYINAHGSSTPLNDSTETLAIKHVFGDHAFKVTISGTKGYYGHALGASGAIEAATCALGMERGWLPPTVNLETPDPDCDLHYLADGGLDGRPRRVVSNSFGFGGVNAALVFGAA